MFVTPTLNCGRTPAKIFGAGCARRTAGRNFFNMKRADEATTAEPAHARSQQQQHGATITTTITAKGPESADPQLREQRPGRENPRQRAADRREIRARWRAMRTVPATASWRKTICSTPSTTTASSRPPRRRCRSRISSRTATTSTTKTAKTATTCESRAMAAAVEQPAAATAMARSQIEGMPAEVALNASWRRMADPEPQSRRFRSRDGQRTGVTATAATAISRTARQWRRRLSAPRRQSPRRPADERQRNDAGATKARDAARL